MDDLDGSLPGVDRLLAALARGPHRLLRAEVLRVEGERIFSRKEITELKRLVRDRVAPSRDLGHVDRWFA